jgi:hypothetical protein
VPRIDPREARLSAMKSYPLKSRTHFATDGHLLSILAMIRSAIAMASAMADSSAGEGRPSQFASFLAARMLAAMSTTRLRPSSKEDSLAYSSFVRLLLRNDNFRLLSGGV